MRANNAITKQNLAQYTGQWLEEIRAEVHPRPQLILDEERCALLIVDMNNYFSDPRGRGFFSAAAAIVPQIQILMNCFRRSKRPVLFTRHGHDGPDDTFALGRFFTDFIARDSADAQIIDALSPLQEEPVFEKKTYDAFLNAGLEAYLKTAGVSQLLIAGVLTQMCVETTARTAFCRNFDVFIPADATATTTPEIHLRSLHGMASAVAKILCTAEIEAAWKQM